VYTTNSDNEKTLLWADSGNKAQQWVYANVMVGNNKNYSVIFEAQAYDSVTSDIAIDDVSFTPECATGSKCWQRYFLNYSICLICVSVLNLLVFSERLVYAYGAVQKL